MNTDTVPGLVRMRAPKCRRGGRVREEGLLPLCESFHDGWLPGDSRVSPGLPPADAIEGNATASHFALCKLLSRHRPETQGKERS